MEVAPVSSQPIQHNYSEPNGQTSFECPSATKNELSIISRSLGLNYLACVDRIFMKQQTQILDELSGCELNNRYDFQTINGHLIFRALEDSNECAKFWCGSGRTLKFEIYDSHGRKIMHLRRPTGCCSLGVLTADSPTGEKIGTVHKHCWSSSFTVKNSNGEIVLQIKGPRCSQPCCRGSIIYHIFDEKGQNEVGKISKEWAGEIQESYIATDNYDISFPIDADVNLKAIILGATVFIDFVYYEKRLGKRTRRH